MTHTPDPNFEDKRTVYRCTVTISEWYLDSYNSGYNLSSFENEVVERSSLTELYEELAIHYLKDTQKKTKWPQEYTEVEFGDIEVLTVLDCLSFDEETVKATTYCKWKFEKERLAQEAAERKRKEQEEADFKKAYEVEYAMFQELRKKFES